MIRARRAATVVALAVSASVLAGAVAVAAYGDGASASATMSTATLAPPSGLSVTTACVGLLQGSKATLSWTATPSTFAEGYTLERRRGATLETTVTITPRTTTSYVDSPLSNNTSYTWTLWATAHSWTSTAVSVSGTTPLVC